MSLINKYYQSKIFKKEEEPKGSQKQTHGK